MTFIQFVNPSRKNPTFASYQYQERNSFVVNTLDIFERFFNFPPIKIRNEGK